MTTRKYQFVRYPLERQTLFRLFYEPDAVGGVFAWRIAVGPFELRKWSRFCR